MAMREQEVGGGGPSRACGARRDPGRRRRSRPHPRGRGGARGPTKARTYINDDLISVVFTATADLRAEFPAYAARLAGITDVPLLCATEIDVPGALPRVIRLLAHVETTRTRAEVRHVYLRGAAALRTDLPQ